MILRIVILGAVVALAYAGVGVASRRPGRSGLAVPPGITLIEGGGCHQCKLAKDRFEAAGVVFEALDLESAAGQGLSTMTVPTVYVGSADGALIMTRRGSSVLEDLEDIVVRATTRPSK